MPQKSQLHVNQLLSNVSVAYRNEEYIGSDLFPQLQVVKDTDYYRTYDRSFRVPETRRAPRGVANEHTFEFSLAAYALENHALKDYVSDDDEQQNDQGSLMVDTTEELTDAIYRRMELSVASLFTTTNWSLNVSLAAAAAFSNNTMTSDPVAVYDTAASTIIANSGKTPNFGYIPRAGFIALKNHVAVLDRVKYTSSEVSKNMIQALIGVPQLFVPTAIQDVSAKGLAFQGQPFFNGNSFIGWKPASAGLKTPSCGYLIMSKTPRTRTWRDEERESTAVEVACKYQAKVIASLTGFLINGI